MYTYAWYHWLTFFYLYCFFGWVFESAYVSVQKRRFVNRGFLHMPMLPLYGTGAVMMLWVSLPVKDNLILVYLSGVVAATILEYVTGCLMEWLFKVKYWDYSDQKYNLNGYICLSSSIAWGFLTILMTEVIHRPIERLVLDLNPTAEWGFLAFTSALFVTDTIQSTREALDLAKALETATKLRGELDELQLKMALLRAEVTENMQNNVQNLREALDLAHQEVKASYLEAVETRREALEEHMNALSETVTEKTAALRQHIEIHRPAILRRNPGASSRRFAAALKELKDSVETRKPF